MDVWLKLERAGQHFNELQQIFHNSVRQYENFATGNDKAFHGSERSIVATLPKHTPTVLGDALHNLRASLDYAYCVCTRRNGQTVPETGVFGFPFRGGNDVERFARTGSKGKLKPVPCDRVLSYIVDEMQPYSGGVGNLYSVHELDRSDKHQLIIPSVMSQKVTELSFKRKDGGIFTISNLKMEIPYTYGQEVSPFVVPAGTIGVPENKGKVVFDIIFQNGPCAGLPIVKTIAQLGETVTMHVKTLDELSR